MESQSELVGGEQNGQTSQPLVANQNHQSPGKDQKCRARKRVNEKNDQNVKSKADGKKKAKSPGKDQRYRDKKKKEVEEMDRELKKARAENEDLKLTNAFSNGKLAQAQEDMEVIKGCFSFMKEVVTQHGALINMLLQPLVVAGTINQFGATMEPGGQVSEWNNVEQPGLTYGGDLNYTSLLGAAMASGSSPMQGSLAPGGQARGNNSEQPTPYNADQFPGVN
uniref:BZIP domain-containing protein n=2 Tax=Salix TaxID=40685 RepID=A0A6N2NA64_SALVM